MPQDRWPTPALCNKSSEQPSSYRGKFEPGGLLEVGNRAWTNPVEPTFENERIIFIRVGTIVIHLYLETSKDRRRFF